MKASFPTARWAGAFRLNVVSAALLLAASGAHAVTMQVSDARVSQPGQQAEICVGLASEGQSVAGTQNELVWDGGCATLTEGSCQIRTAGKQLSTAFPPGTDFTLRAFVLALDNVDPIADGLLYCCNFISELSSTGTCVIRISNALAADPTGKPVQVRAQNGSIRFTGSGSAGAGGGPGGPAGGGPGGVVGGLVERPAGQPQVFEGGGPAVQPTPIVIEPQVGETPAEEEEEEETPIAEETPGATASVAPTTAAPTAAPTTAVPGTPTSKPATAPPTAAPALAPAAAAKDDGGWFSCQMTPNGRGSTSLMLIALAGMVALRFRRRSGR
jgi:hypothetical protein